MSQMSQLLFQSYLRCFRSTCRVQTSPVLGKMGSPRRQPQSCNSPQRRLHSPLPVLAILDQVIHHNKLLCISPQEPLPVGGIASAVEKKCSRVGQKSRISGYFGFQNLIICEDLSWTSVVNLHKFQRCIHVPIHSQSRKYMCFHCRVSPTNSKHFHLVYPQHPWSLW